MAIGVGRAGRRPALAIRQIVQAGESPALRGSTAWSTPPEADATRRSLTNELHLIYLTGRQEMPGNGIGPDRATRVACNLLVRERPA